jgi:hypothetical protein
MGLGIYALMVNLREWQMLGFDIIAEAGKLTIDLKTGNANDINAPEAIIEMGPFATTRH